MKDKNSDFDPELKTIHGEVSSLNISQRSGVPVVDSETSLIGFNRFSVAKERISFSKHFSDSRTSLAPYGMFSGRPIIGECNGILGGVYISATPREALVIDEVFEFLPKIWEGLRRDISTLGPRKAGFENLLLDCINRTVHKALTYSPKGVAELHTAYNIKADQKVALDTYIRAGVGDRRHIALLGSYLIEKLKTGGYLSGAINLDPVIRTFTATDERLVYVKEDGEYWFLDE